MKSKTPAKTMKKVMPKKAAIGTTSKGQKGNSKVIKRGKGMC